MVFEEIHTNRLVLRKFTKETFDIIYSLPHPEDQMKWLGVSSPEELETQRKKYDFGLETYNRRFLYFHLVHNDQIIGWCGYHTWYIDHNRAEIGYWLYDDSHKQNGFMSEAMEAILAYGFNDMNLNRIEAFVGKNNVASLQTLKKFNFKEEGVLREHYINKSDPEDSLVFSLLKSEYTS